jgi:hypothetical protein
MNTTDKIYAKDGLLWVGGTYIPLPEADRVAQLRGFFCAEQLVRSLEAKQRTTPPESEAPNTSVLPSQPQTSCAPASLG